MPELQNEQTTNIANAIEAKDDCVSAKIPKLLDEGYDQDQAAAIAYSMCEDDHKTAEAIIEPHVMKSHDDALTIELNLNDPSISVTQLPVAVIESDANYSGTKTYFTAAAVKALGDGKIGGYLVVWGSPDQRDSHGEYFLPETDFALDYYKDRPVLYHHGLSGIEGEKIGTIYKIVPDMKGLYAEAQLDMQKPHARQVYNMVNNGTLGWSSGSVPHLVEIGDDGRIKKWPIVEGSLTPTPAEPHRTTVQAIKSVTPALTDEPLETPKEPTAKGADEPVTPPARVKTKSANKNPKGVKMNTTEMVTAYEKAGLSPEQIVAVLKEMGTVEATAPEPEGDEVIMADPAATPPTEPPAEGAYASKGKTPERPMTRREMQEYVESYMRTAPANVELPGVELNIPQPEKAQRIEVQTPTHNLSAEDISYMIHMRTMMGARQGKTYTPPTPLLRELAVKTQAAIKSGQLDFGMEENDPNISRNNQILAIKSNELDNTGVAAAAGNWVWEAWSSVLWKRIRLPNRVSGQFQVVEMPAATFDLPVEDADPTVYYVPETTDAAQLSLASGAAIPASLVSAGKVQLVAKKLALRVGFSTEMMEDSIIQFIPQLREQAVWAMENAVDNVLINGDTTNSSANINFTPGGATDKFLCFNGMRYLSLITNASANATPIDAAGAQPDLSMLRTARFRMISTLNAYGIEPENLFMVCDPYTYGRMLQIDELLAYFNNGRGSTVNDGVLPPTVDGVAVFPSSQIPLTASTGKVAASANNFGTIIIGAKNAWKVGYRRNITSSLDYLPYYDSYQLTQTIRLAFKNKDNYANNTIYDLAIS